MERNNFGIKISAAHNVTVDGCQIKDNRLSQIDIDSQFRDKDGQCGIDGPPSDLDQVNWHCNPSITLDGVVNTNVRNSVISTSIGASSQLFRYKTFDNQPDKTWYEDWYKKEFVGESNVYFKSDTTIAFVTDYWTDSTANSLVERMSSLSEWKALTGSDKNSRWATDEPVLQAQNIIYPPNSGIVHMVEDYGLVANDLSEAAGNTAKIQQAIDDNKGQSFGSRSGILYFPNGTYFVNDKMSLGSVKADCRYITFQGQSREGTAIKLVDGSAGFGEDANKPVIVFTEASGTNIGFRNYVKNLTLDIGANNPGAIGVDFICNNHGGLFDVTIKSSDSQKRGAIGLKMDRNLGGIGLIKNVRIEGFDIGIKTGSFKINYVFEYLELDGQNVAGIQNTDKPLSIRKLTTTNLEGPAIVNTTAPGHIVLIDSELGGAGAVAIDNQQGFVFARNVTTTGYSNAMNDRDSILVGSYIEEYASHGVYQLWDSTPAKSLNLEIKETPVVPWQTDLSKWIVVDASGNGSEDDAPAIQAAIDSCTAANGKNTVCIRVSKDNAGKVVLKTPVVIRGNVQRFLVLGAQFALAEPLLSANGAVFTLESTNYDVLVVEGFQFAGVPQSTGDLSIIQNNSAKTVILRDVSTFNGGSFYRNDPSAGPLFVEIGGHQFTHPQAGGTVGWEFTNQEVYARDINPEDVDTGIINDGGKLWILGYKFESDIADKPVHHMITKNGGYTEVLGGVDNGVFAEDTASAIHINDNSNVSHISAERARNEAQRHTTLIREIRGDVTRAFTFGDLPTVSNSDFIESSVIPLYVGYEPFVTEPEEDTAYALNAGGAAYTATDGIVYEADANFTGGTALDRPGTAIVGTTEDTLYASERYGAFSYALPVSNGEYDITFKFAELNFNQAGKRIFDVVAERQEVVSNLDIYAKVGKNTAYDTTVRVEINDGAINLNFTPQVNNAQLCALVVAPAEDSDSVPQPGTYYYIENQTTGKRIHTNASDTLDMGPTVWSGGYSQWEFVSTTNGYYQIKNRNTDKVIKSSTNNKLGICDKCTGNYAQWQLIDAGDSFYRIELRANVDRPWIHTEADDRLDRVATTNLGGYTKWKLVAVDNNGSQAADALEKLKEKLEWLINVYPNPAQDEVVISCPFPFEDVKVKLLDLFGHIVRQVSSEESSIVIQTANLPAGLYIVELEVQGNTLRRRLLIGK